MPLAEDLKPCTVCGAPVLWGTRHSACGRRVPEQQARQTLIEDAITKATGAHRVLNAYDYEDVFACCEAVLTAAARL